MADEHAPIPSPHPSSRFTTPSSVTPIDSSNGVVPKDHEPLPVSEPNLRTNPSELAMVGRWLFGCLLVAVSGWGILFLALYLTRSYTKNMEIAGSISAVLTLGLFLFLERNFWLSRFMGLRVDPHTRPWQSAMGLWFLGVPGLLFRSTDFHPEREAQGATRRHTATQTAQRPDSVREVVETIVFVVVLVLLLKSFAAEAFVIPTGSMGQTLLGYQKDVVCPDCGLKFPINCSQEVDPSDGGRPIPVYACVCPNCRQHIHFGTGSEGYLSDHPDSRSIADPGWNSGDRVLVAKFVYDLFDKMPDRLDVVVFKYPGGDNFPMSGPHRNHVPMNYIKRLIGESGETIAIRGGKLYVLSPGKGPHYEDYARAKQDPDLMATLWQKQFMHINEASNRFDEFQIIRKKPENILSMMRLVYDNDHPSKSDPQTANRWRSVEGTWTANGAHGFRSPASASDKTEWLRYNHILRDDHGKRSLITDIMGYNTYQSGLPHERPQHPPQPGYNWVGDLILECEATLDAPQGELTLELSKGVDRFRARWDLATGICTLLRDGSDGEQVLDSKPTTLKKKGTYKLRFANVDDRLVVWVDGELPFDSGVPYSAAKELGPREANDFEPASIGSRGAAVTLDKVKLFRDTYYTVGGPNFERPDNPDVPGVRFTDPDTWDGLRNPPILTMYVQPEHFLCLGDNSPESSDGRSWGTVPRRLLLGRALLVYYPFGRAGRIR